MKIIDDLIEPHRFLKEMYFEEKKYIDDKLHDEVNFSMAQKIARSVEFDYINRPPYYIATFESIFEVYQ